MNIGDNMRRFQALHREPAGQGRVLLGHKAVDACMSGLERGALHEIFAAEAGQAGAATGFAAALARRLGEKRRLLWVRQDYAAREYGELSANGFSELGLDPDRLILVGVADAVSVLQVAMDALSCRSLGAVIAEILGAPKILDLTASRRLVLAAASKNVTALLLRLNAKPEPSAAETRWIIKAAHSTGAEDWGWPHFDVQLTRNRHGPTGRWLMEWNCDDGAFQDSKSQRKTYSGVMAAAPADRSHSTAADLRRRA